MEHTALSVHVAAESIFQLIGSYIELSALRRGSITGGPVFARRRKAPNGRCSAKDARQAVRDVSSWSFTNGRMSQSRLAPSSESIPFQDIEHLGKEFGHIDRFFQNFASASAAGLFFQLFGGVAGDDHDG